MKGKIDVIWVMIYKFLVDFNNIVGNVIGYVYGFLFNVWDIMEWFCFEVYVDLKEVVWVKCIVLKVGLRFCDSWWIVLSILLIFISVNMFGKSSRFMSLLMICWVSFSIFMMLIMNVLMWKIMVIIFWVLLWWVIKTISVILWMVSSVWFCLCYCLLICIISRKVMKSKWMCGVWFLVKSLVKSFLIWMCLIVMLWWVSCFMLSLSIWMVLLSLFVISRYVMIILLSIFLRRLLNMYWFILLIGCSITCTLLKLRCIVIKMFILFLRLWMIVVCCFFFWKCLRVMCLLVFGTKSSNVKLICFGNSICWCLRSWVNLKMWISLRIGCVFVMFRLFVLERRVLRIKIMSGLVFFIVGCVINIKRWVLLILRCTCALWCRIWIFMLDKFSAFVMWFVCLCWVLSLFVIMKNVGLHFKFRCCW